jgi:hypothetical protein
MFPEFRFEKDVPQWRRPYNIFDFRDRQAIVFTRFMTCEETRLRIGAVHNDFSVKTNLLLGGVQSQHSRLSGAP